MKNKGTIVRRLTSVTLVAVMTVWQLLPVGIATALSIPSPSKVAKELEQRYHLNTSSIQNFGETFNVSDSKKYAPEVSLLFSPSDPRDGQKITAKSFPMYFSNPSDQLYYTWYLKRKGCDLGSASKKPSYCNADGSGGITINDWKVAAARVMATDGADKAGFSYRSDTDADGYDAEFGGGAESGTSNDWCYVHDQSSGKFYELVSSSSSDSFACGTGGYIPACVSGSQDVGSDMSSTYVYESTGTPACVSGSPSCPDGTLARCVEPSVANATFNLSSTEDNLSCSSGDAKTQRCVHLFPHPSGTGETSGDGKFGTREEFFWGTNPGDPDTADNGNKDESNVVGLGQDSFSWNYQSGDQVGVVVEGTSMIPTKHSDSSMMIMWAFSGNGCTVRNTGSYNTTIGGYSVNIPTANMSEDDLNSCLENGLSDPLIGGQNKSKKLELDVTATPTDPVNDQTAEKSGDVVNATASIVNAEQPDSAIVYEWKIEVNDDPVDWNGSRAENVTEKLKSAGLLPLSCKMKGTASEPVCVGNGLDAVSIALNMGSDILGNLADTDPLYMRISVTASENYGGMIARSGRGETVVRVANTDKKILSYVSSAVPYGTTYKMTLADGNTSDSNPLTPICNDFHPNPTTAGEATDNLDRIACRVIRNEIIGVRVDNASGEFKDFSWTVDGKALSCDASVSDDADCRTNGNEAFFAVVGDPGTAINVRADAVDVTTGKSISLTRTFNIVEPEIELQTADQSTLWPRYVGQYVDLDGKTFDEFSTNFFEKSTDAGIRMQARFIPAFAKNLSTRTWTIDGATYPDETVWNTTEGDFVGIDAITAAKPAGSVYNVSVSATLVQPVEKRRALRDIWGIPESQSGEVTIGKAVQIQNVEVAPATEASSGIRKFYAALSTYVPPTIAFAFRIFLSGGLLLFAVGFAFSFIPEHPSESVRKPE